MVFICVYAVSIGTSWNALFDAIIVQPFLISNVFVKPIQIPMTFFALDAVALLAAYVHVRNIDSQKKSPVSSAFVFLATGFATLWGGINSAASSWIWT